MSDTPKRNGDQSRDRDHDAGGDAGGAEEDASSIATFCKRHGFSESMFFKLHASGKGPRTMKVGCRTLIGKEAAADWRRAREAAAAEED
jgi:hypothetical protein